MYEMRDLDTGETIRTFEDDLPRAKSAFIHHAMAAERPVVLVGPDGEEVMRARQSGQARSA